MTHDIRYGIAAQIALFDFLRDRLAAAGTGWRLTMTEPGSAKDRLQGIDFYLESPAGVTYPVDVSFRDKPDRLTLVMSDDWFTLESRESFKETGKLAVDPGKYTDIRRAVGRVLLPLIRKRP